MKDSRALRVLLLALCSLSKLSFAPMLLPPPSAPLLVISSAGNTWAAVCPRFETARIFAFLPESSRAATHDLALADELGVELGAVEGEVDIEVDAVESALRRVHALEVFLEVLSAEVGCQSDDFLYACNNLLVSRYCSFPSWTQLTWILGVLGTHIFVASVEYILVHERCTWSHLSEE